MRHPEDRPSSATSPTLLAGLQVGNDGAWVRLVECYTPRLRQWCRAQGLDEATTHDVLQETWISVSKSLSRFESTPGSGAFRAWLRRILLRRIADFRRNESRRPTIAGGGSILGKWADVASNSSISSVDHRAAGKTISPELLQRIEAIRESIDPKTWDIFTRLVVDGRSTASVAEEFAISPANVRQIRSRMLRKLKKE